MRLKLEVFKEILVLTVDQAVTVRGVMVLNAGFQKLAEQHVEWIFVDLSQAQFEPEVVQTAIDTKASLSSPKVKKVFLVGSIPGLCDFATMEQALEACSAKETQLLKQKCRLDREIQALRARKAEMESDATSSGDAQRTKYALLAENRQLKRLRRLMTMEIEAVQKASLGLGAKAPDTQLLLELQSVRAEIINALREEEGFG